MIALIFCKIIICKGFPNFRMPLYLKYELKHFTSCFFVTETIAHAENGATTDQQFSVESIDSASNSVAPRRPPAQRSTSEYHTLPEAARTTPVTPHPSADSPPTPQSWDLHAHTDEWKVGYVRTLF